MRVISLPQPAATLTITRAPCDGEPAWPHDHHGRICASNQMVSRWVTFDYVCPSEVVGTRIAIAATEDEPNDCVVEVGDYEMVRWFDHDGGSGWELQHDSKMVAELPLGVEVGSAIVEASFKIIVGHFADDWTAPCVVATPHDLFQYDALLRNGRDISDQLPYADWSPGRFAWHLTEAEALPEPVRWVSSGGRLPEWDPT